MSRDEVYIADETLHEEIEVFVKDYYDEIRKAVESVAPEADFPPKQSFDYGSVLGCGSYGCVYPVPGDASLVFKVTSDPHEGDINYAVLRESSLQSHPGVARILGVWKVEFGIVIVREDVEPLSPTEKANMHGLYLNRIDDNGRWMNTLSAQGKEDSRDFSEHKKLLEYALDDAVEEDPDLEHVIDFIRSFYAVYGHVLEDVHPRNIGWDTEYNMVIFDLGFASGPGMPPPPEMVANPRMPALRPGGSELPSALQAAYIEGAWVGERTPVYAQKVTAMKDRTYTGFYGTVVVPGNLGDEKAEAIAHMAWRGGISEESYYADFAKWFRQAAERRPDLFEVHVFDVYPVDEFRYVGPYWSQAEDAAENPVLSLPPGFEGFAEEREASDAVPVSFQHLGLRYGDVIDIGGRSKWVVVKPMGTYTLDVKRPTDNARTRLRFEAQMDHDGDIEVVAVGYRPDHSWGRINDKVYDTGLFEDIEVIEQ